MDPSPDQPPLEPGLQVDQHLVDRGWLKIGAGAAIAAQAMVFSLAVNLSEIAGWAYVAVHTLLICAALGALLFLGGDLLRSAWEAVGARKINIDLLFLLTLAGAFFGSLVSTFTRTGSVYYEVVAILIVVHTAGKMLAARSRLAALSAVRATRDEFDTCQVVQPDGTLLRVPCAAIRGGESVGVSPGAAIAVDGTIVQGRGFVRETSMTGEWRPVSRGPGEPVMAGTYSVDGSFVVRATGGRRRLDAILDAVEQARLAPSRLQQQADRLIGWFLPLVVATSAATFLGWWWHAPWDRALFNAMAVLLVACPCAMGLATPVAIWSGLARLARMGLVARTGDVLDALGRTDMVCIDKTGTLSENSLSVREWRIPPAFRARTAWLKAAVRALEEGLRHPAAEALRAACADAPPLTVTDRGLEPGRGVVGLVSAPGVKTQTVAVGEASLGVGFVRGGGKGAGKEVYVFVDGELAATIELEERWRAGLTEALVQLRNLGVGVEVLTGDPHPTEGLAALVAVRGGLGPEQKSDRVRELVAQGRTVLFAGDGINDAAAMAQAHGSIAMRGGADLARAAAMAVFAGEDLRFLPHAIRIARATRRGISRNLVFAAAYNLVGMVLAASGILHPVAAALLMVGSSLFVSVSALRAARAED